MAKKLNGNLKIVLGICVTVLLAALASAMAFGVFQGEIKKDVTHNHEDIVGLKAVDVTQDTALNMAMRHVYEDEIETPYIQDDVAHIKVDIKALEQGVSEFAEEQRKVNTQILNKLDER